MSARKRKGERADGLIQVCATLGHDAGGKRIRRVFYGHTRAEAERKRDEYLALYRSGSNYPAEITVSEWVDIYLRTYRTGVNPLYFQNDDVPYKRLKGALGDRPVQSIREYDLQQALNGVAGMSFSTANKYKQAIRRVFQKAHRNRVIPSDPSVDLQLPQFTRGTHKALTAGEIRLVSKNWRKAGAAGLWTMLMLYTGLRRGEMMALDWSAVDLAARTLTVRQTAVIRANRALIENRAKTSAGVRIIPIPAPCYEALCEAAAGRRTGFVCLSERGMPLTETAVTRGLERAVKRLGVQFRWHDLRHTYCSMLYSAGVDVKTAAYLMGHADVTVTMKIYTHLSEQKQAESTAGLLTFFDSLAGE